MTNSPYIKNVKVLSERSDKNGRYFMIEFEGTFNIGIYDITTRVVFDTETLQFYDWNFSVWYLSGSEYIFIDHFVTNDDKEIGIIINSNDRLFEFIKNEWKKTEDKRFIKKLIIDSMI